MYRFVKSFKQKNTFLPIILWLKALFQEEKRHFQSIVIIPMTTNLRTDYLWRRNHQNPQVLLCCVHKAKPYVSNRPLSYEAVHTVFYFVLYQNPLWPHHGHHRRSTGFFRSSHTTSPENADPRIWSHRKDVFFPYCRLPAVFHHFFGKNERLCHHTEKRRLQPDFTI